MCLGNGNAPNSPPWGLLLSLCAVLILPRVRYPATAHACIDHAPMHRVAPRFHGQIQAFSEEMQPCSGGCPFDKYRNSKGRIGGILRRGCAMWSHRHVGMLMLLLSCRRWNPGNPSASLVASQKIKDAPYSFPVHATLLPAIFQRSASAVKHLKALLGRDRRGGRDPRAQALGHETCQNFPGTILRARGDLAWKPHP